MPSEEFWVALAGPMVNFVAGGGLLAWTYFQGAMPALAHWQQPTDANLIPRLAVANLILAFFNLLPAFPMDGGRVVRALREAARGGSHADDARTGHRPRAMIGLYGLLSANFLLVFLVFHLRGGHSGIHGGFGAGADPRGLGAGGERTTVL